MREYPDARAEFNAANASSAASYTVTVGDNLISVAHAHGITVDQLYAANQEAIDRKGVEPHMQLRIPAATPRPAVVAASALSSCRKHVERIAEDAERCATDLKSKILELQDTRTLMATYKQQLDDAKKGGDALEAMTKTMEELKAAKQQ